MSTLSAASPRARLPAGPSRRIYDVIVFGAHMGGPLSAALLARRGYRVLYVEHDGLGQGYAHGGYLLPWAPFVMPALKTMPAVEQALHELGMNTTVQRAQRPHQPELQVILERHRVDLHADAAKRKAELSRELGDEGAARLLTSLSAMGAQHERTNALFKTVEDLPPPPGFFRRWGVQRALSRFNGAAKESPALESIGGGDEVALLARTLGGLGRFNRYLDVGEEDAAPLAAVRPLSQLLHGPLRYPNGRSGLHELLVKKVQDLGGDVVTRGGGGPSAVERLTFDGSKVSGVALQGSQNAYAGNAVIAATDPRTLAKVLEASSDGGPAKRLGTLKARLDAVEVKRALFTVNWVVPSALLPRGMGELLLLDAPDETDAGSGTILIQVSGARKASGDEVADLKGVCAAAFVPAGPDGVPEPSHKAIRERIERALDGLMPFVREQASVRSAALMDGGPPARGVVLHPELRVEGERFAGGVTGLLPEGSVKNLILGGREVLPGLGLEGELQAGIRAARGAHALLGKKDPLKR